MIIFADFETYWDKTYTLSKLTPPEYILDPRFQVHGCAIQENLGGTPRWLNAGATAKYFAEASRTGTGVCTFNALFDASILAWRYDFVPALLIDVLGMARAIIGSKMPGRSYSLKNVANYLNLGQKGTEAIATMGRSTAELVEDKGAYTRLAEYACQDVRLTADAYKILRPEFPNNELFLNDMVLRAAIQPQLQLDRQVLLTNIGNEERRKANLLARSGALPPTLMSAIKFKALIESMGVPVPDKVSPTGKPIPAVAKTDSFMQDLTEHPDADVAALAAARLGLKSTLEETRSRRLLSIASLPELGAMAPVPIKYGAARTHRWGGDWKINLQNLPRGSELRKAFAAPKNHTVVVADLKQIEARMAAWFCKQKNLIELFSQNLDPYAHLASEIFNRNIDPKVDKVERFIGKTGILGLGYGAGAPKFHYMVHTMAKAQLGKDVAFTEADALKTVQTYRKTYPRIPHMWRTLDNVIEDELHKGALLNTPIPPLLFAKEQITLPGGLKLLYPDLELVNHEWRYRDNNSNPKIYGCKLLENIIQSLARVVLTEMALVIQARTNFRFAMQVHDELVYVIHNDLVDDFKKTLNQIMTEPPSWALGLPLGVDIHTGKTYGDAK